MSHCYRKSRCSEVGRLGRCKGAGGIAVAFAMFIGSMLATTGCVEICAALDCGLFDNDNSGSDGGGPPDNNNDNSGEEVLRVGLTISNTNPTIGDEVELLCRVVSGEVNETARFQFQPAATRLVVDERQGVARFIVDETDVGVQFSATCTVTADGETSGPSNRVSFIASG